MSDLPKDVSDALSHLNRFSHLEIAGAKFVPPPASQSAASGHNCPHCGQSNEGERETCWACFCVLKKATPAAAPVQEITLVIDGNTYRSGDPKLPEDVKVLMERIGKQGYSQNLFVEWQNWRAAKGSAPSRTNTAGKEEFLSGAIEGVIDSNRGQISEAGSDINVFKGMRVSVIKLDGKIYTSDNPHLTPDFKQLFHYLDANGVTPALMDRLRQMGDKVKFRPETTAAPTDGDIAFWKDVQEKQAVHIEAGGMKPPWEAFVGEAVVPTALIPVALVFVVYLVLKFFF